MPATIGSSVVSTHVSKSLCYLFHALTSFSLHLKCSRIVLPTQYLRKTPCCHWGTEVFFVRRSFTSSGHDEKSRRDLTRREATPKQGEGGQLNFVKKER